MTGLVPAIHAAPLRPIPKDFGQLDDVMTGTSPVMTALGARGPSA
jgi:hypothetical protein